MRESGSRAAGRHRANGSIGAFAVVWPVVGGLTMSALVTGAVVLLASGSQPDNAPVVPARTYTSEQTVASEVPTTTSTPGSNATTPPTTTTADATTTDGPAERCPGNQPEHVRRKVCD